MLITKCYANFALTRGNPDETISYYFLAICLILREQFFVREGLCDFVGDFGEQFC